jgi:hypothetical protein
MKNETPIIDLNETAESGGVPAPQHPRALYLADKPEEAAFQLACIESFNSNHELVLAKIKEHNDAKVDIINAMRLGGEILLKLAEKLPGKQITFDFHQYFSGTGAGLLKADFNAIKNYLRVASNLKEDIRTVAEAKRFEQSMFAVMGELPESRAPQQLHAPANPYNELMEFLKPTHLEGLLLQLEKSEKFGPIATWPEERKASVRVQIEPTKQKFDQLWAQLSN